MKTRRFSSFLFVSLCVRTCAVFNSSTNRIVTHCGSTDYAAYLRLVISDCFHKTAVDDVITDDVSIHPDDWWPPTPVTTNMIKIMTAACRSEEYRIKSAKCIQDVYSSVPVDNMGLNMALAQLPLPGAWARIHETVCESKTAVLRDLPCVAYLRFQEVLPCVQRRQKILPSNVSNLHQLLVCRLVDAVEDCQRKVYESCSTHVASTLAAITRFLSPSLCPYRHVTDDVTSDSDHVISSSVSELLLSVLTWTFLLIGFACR